MNRLWVYPPQVPTFIHEFLLKSFLIHTPTLRETFPYWEFFWSVFPHIRTEYGEIQSISPYSIRMRENTDQKNSEYGHYSRSGSISIKLKLGLEIIFDLEQCILRKKRPFNMTHSLVNLLCCGLAALLTTTGKFLWEMSNVRIEISTSLSKIWGSSLSKTWYPATFTKKICLFKLQFNQTYQNMFKGYYNLTKLLKETRNSFKKWPLNLWWISNKTDTENGNITKATTFKSFLYLSYKKIQLLAFVTVLFNYFHETMVNLFDFGGLHKNKDCAFPST